jgi:hypothetical protein
MKTMVEQREQAKALPMQSARKMALQKVSVTVRATESAPLSVWAGQRKRDRKWH